MALTWWSHWTRLSGGLALMWHSKYTSSPSLMLVGSRAGARRACTSGATVKEIITHNYLGILTTYIASILTSKYSCCDARDARDECTSVCSRCRPALCVHLARCVDEFISVF